MEFETGRLEMTQVDFTTRSTTAILLAAFSGILLGSAYIDLRLAIVPWFALLPLLIGLHRKSLVSAWMIGSTFGLAFMATGSHWILTVLTEIRGTSPWKQLPIMVILWLAFSQWFALMTICYVWFMRHSRFPEVLVFPVVGTTFFEYGSFVFPITLGVTQSSLPAALQALDLFGHSGLVFAIMMFNAVLCREFLRSPSESSAKWDLSFWGAIAVCFVWFIYGYFRMQYWENFAYKKSPIAVGLIQGNDPPSVSQAPPSAGFLYSEPPEIFLYRKLSAAGADVIIWPESRVKGYFRYPHVQRRFQQEVNQNKSGLLMQDMNMLPGQGAYNTAILLSDFTEPQYYQKVERVLFGEYLPTFIDGNGFGSVVKRYLGQFYQPILAGGSATTFSLGDSVWLPLICYEAASSSHIVNGINQAPETPQWISVQSNNSWFGNTIQPHLHLAVTQLRAVENRLPVVHAINNGPSAIIDQTGQYVIRTAEHVAGASMASMQPAEPGTTTFYNQNPYLLGKFLFLSWIALLSLSFRSGLNSTSRLKKSFSQSPTNITIHKQKGVT